MAKYSPNEFLYARPIASALLHDRTFRQWFLADTKFAAVAADALPLGEDQSSLRSTPNSKRWWWFNHYCPKDGSCTCKLGTGLETDILIIFEVIHEIRFALHVEVKRPSETLGDGQAETYPRRAACWSEPTTRPRRILAHEDYVTVLVCGDNLRADSRRSAFDQTRFHRDIEQRISPYPDLSDIR